MSSYTHYAMILSCVLFCFLRTSQSFHLPKARWLLSGFLLTALADYFLIFTSRHVFGIFFFCLVQYCYGKILVRPTLPFFENGYFLFFLLCMNKIFQTHTFLFILLFSSLYITFLIFNLYYCFVTGYVHLYLVLFLMLLCDIQVGFANLPSFFYLPPDSLFSGLCRLAPSLLWCFYLPSQILLCTLPLNDG